MAKQMSFDEEARRCLKKGIHMLAEVVKVTLGPPGVQRGAGQAF